MNRKLTVGMETGMKADLMLIIVTLAWGFSYVLTDVCLSELSTFTLNAFRFLLAFGIVAALGFKRMKNISRRTLKYSVIVGTLLAFLYVCYTVGLQHTLLSNAGFLCALAVVFTPIFSTVINKKRPEKKIVLVVSMCLGGIMLLTLGEGFKINQETLKGDLLCIVCSIGYSFHLLITEKAVAYEDVDAFQVGVLQLGVTGIINLLLALVLEAPHSPQTTTVWASLIFLSIFCTGIAFIVQTVAQKYTSASHVGVIFSMEPVIAGLVAFVFAGEVLLPRAYFGMVLIVCGVLLMELKRS